MLNTLPLCIYKHFFVYSFHNKLKTNPRYLNHKVNRRCDDLIEVLLSVEADLFYERKRKEVLTSTKTASLKIDGDRHVNGAALTDTKLKVGTCTKGAAAI